jgi:hypothetical protein
MIELNFQLAPTSLSAVRTMIGTLVAALENETDSRHEAPSGVDMDLRAVWQDELHVQLDDDLSELRKLLAMREFGVRPVALQESVAEAVLRACSAVRLKIQQSLLKSVGEAELESGGVNFQSLSLVEQQAYAVYAFLAGLQETLVGEMDPEI